MDQQTPLIIAVDLGGTRIRAALSDFEGRFLIRMERPTEADQGQEAIIERLTVLIQEVCHCQMPSSGICMGVGVSAPGPLEPQAGLILSAPNLPGWRDVPLQAILEERLELPVRLVNDGSAAALAEWVYGAGRDYQNLVYVTISTGVGGGVVADGRPLLGYRGLAGELGHMTLQADGPRCNCGNYGCWEALASGTAIAREGAAAVREGRSPLLAELCQGEADRLGAQLIGEAARQGDPVARQIVEQAARYSGIGVANLLHLFSPELVLIGGGVSNLGALFFEPLRRVARERVMPAYRDVPIEPSFLGPDVSLLGALAWFLLEEVKVKDEPLAPEVVDRISQQVLQSYPEMEGAEVTVAPRRIPDQAAVAAKLGLPMPKGAGEPLYTVTLRKEVPAEDGVTIPLTVRVTVDAQGRIVKGREGH